MTDPVDSTHAEAMFLTNQIRQHVMLLKTQAAMWAPRSVPSPDEWPGHDNCYRHRRRR